MIQNFKSENLQFWGFQTFQPFLLKPNGRSFSNVLSRLILIVSRLNFSSKKQNYRLKSICALSKPKTHMERSFVLKGWSLPGVYCITYFEMCGASHKTKSVEIGKYPVCSIKDEWSLWDSAG